MKLSSHAWLFIVAGLYLALGGLLGYNTVNAAIVLGLGIWRFRWDRSRWAGVLIGISLLVLILSQFIFFALLVLFSLGFYYVRTRPHAARHSRSAHRLFLNLRLDEEPWVLHAMSYWHAIGEVRLDLSMAMPEEKETTIILQGLIGDVDLTVPADYGLEIEASVMIGQIGFGQEKDGGMMHRLSWRSANYEEREFQVKLQLFYLVGDIKIRTV